MFLGDPSSWGTVVSSGVAAAGVVTVVDVPQDQLYRIFSLGAELMAGAAPSLVWWNVVLPGGVVFPITTNSAVSGTRFAPWNDQLACRQLISRQILQFEWSGGDVNTQIDLYALGVFAPAGVVFYT